jgi:hypothetical protein
MKLSKNCKTLILLMLAVIVLRQSSYGQGEPLKCLPVNRYDSLLIAVAEGTQAIINADTYKNEKDKLKKEVERKEGVITSQIEKNKMCYRLTDSLQAQIASLNFVNVKQADIIHSLGKKPKYWQIGIGGGYGYNLGSSITRGFSVGIFLTRQLIKF